MYTDAPRVIQEIIDNIIKVEGGYIDHPSDPGGATNYGITRKVARDNGYFGDMKYLPLSLAQDIYYKDYISRPKFDKVMDLAGVTLSAEVIDAGVNCGTARAAMWLQRSLNAMNQGGKLYPDLIVDGDFGNVSQKALRAFVEYRGTEGILVLTKACNALQGAYYIGLTESNEKFEDFVYGWILHRV